MRKALCAATAVAFLIGGGVPAETRTRVAKEKSATVGKLISPRGTVFSRARFGQPWKIVPAEGAMRAGDLLFGLPGAIVHTGKNAVRLTFQADLDRNSPYPILESAVILHDSADFDLDLTLDRGRVDVLNIKKEGAARVRIRFHKQTWEATLKEPGARLALELYGRWPKGTHFTLNPGPDDVPAAELVLLVLHGHADVKHGFSQHAMSAPPGLALLHWDNSAQADEFPEKLDKLPVWANKEESTSELATTKRKLLEEFRAQILKTSLPQAVEAFSTSEDAKHRALAVIVMGATDDGDGMYKILTETKYPDTWDRAVVVVRNLLGRKPGMDQLLYKRLVEIRKIPPAQARTILELLHSFGDDDLAQPEPFRMLVKYLDHDSFAIRGLAGWHLVRLVPDGQKFAYNPLAPNKERDKAVAQWNKLIEGMLAKGELPFKTTRK
ncbi:MAG TPA: hypothetical protein VMG10_21945 [Gemmataceae bacterium]|nr:hypothetical protein [Gemmataceae bacterium]